MTETCYNCENMNLSVLVPSLDEVVLQNIQTANHLTKDQDSVSPGFQFGQQLVNEHQFTSCLDHGLKTHFRHVRPASVRVSKLLDDLLLCSCAQTKDKIIKGYIGLVVC